MSTRPGRMTRRHFLRSMAIGSAAVVAGLPRRAAGRRRVAQKGGRRRSDDGRLRLAFYTDVHARTEWDTPRAMKRAADAINRQKPDFVIAGGDLITDGFQSAAETVEPRWDAYMAMHEAIEAPVYPVLGNHDLVAAMPEDGTPPADDPRAVFRERLGLDRTYWSFDVRGYHFILLDSVFITNDDLKYHGMIWGEQMDWLKADLAGTGKDTPIVVATHMPLLSSFYHATLGTDAPPPKNRVVVNNREVLALFREHNLVLVLQGHLHVDELIRWRGTTFITGGAVCGKWWRGEWFGTEEGFGMVTLDGDKVDWEYVDYGWDARRPIDQ